EVELSTADQRVPRGGAEDGRAPSRRRQSRPFAGALSPRRYATQRLCDALVRERRDDPHREFAVFEFGRVERPDHRAAQVVVFGVETRPPCELVRSYQTWSGNLSERGVVLRMTATPCVHIGVLLQLS